MAFCNAENPFGLHALHCKLLGSLLLDAVTIGGDDIANGWCGVFPWLLLQ